MDTSEELSAGDPVTMSISLTRDVEEDESDEQIADAPLFPSRKMVNWWLVVGDAATRTLYGIKKTTFKRELNTKLQFSLPQGLHQLKLYVICDSYSGESK